MERDMTVVRLIRVLAFSYNGTPEWQAARDELYHINYGHRDIVHVRHQDTHHTSTPSVDKYPRS